jgi:uncharacterized protein (DUF1697 family)
LSARLASGKSQITHLAGAIHFAQASGMATWIGLLRGIGGDKALNMGKLTQALEAIGLGNVRTYIATGNFVFTSRKGAATLAKEIQTCIRTEFGFEAKTFVLSPAELEAAATANPYRQADENHKSLHLFFLEATPKAPRLDEMKRIAAPTEQFTLKKNVFYFYAPEGFGKSKLGARITQLLGVDATARNWRTVTKLIELANAGK